MIICEVKKIGYFDDEKTNQDDFAINQAVYEPKFDIEEIEKLKMIEAKLKCYSLEQTNSGITAKEAELLLDWVTFKARKFAVRYTGEPITEAHMKGQCSPTQTFNYKLLTKMGLEVNPFNTEEFIGDIPMTEEDKRRADNGWGTTALLHSVLSVKIPIIDNDGITRCYSFLLDPTFRQFCLKENCSESRFWDEKNRVGRVAPHPGYFIQSENLKKFGVSEEEAQLTEKLGRRIISRGYFLFNEKNAKLYGDLFVRASVRREFQREPINKTGREYIENSENNPMQIIDFINKHENSYVKLPSEVKEKKSSWISRFWNNIYSKIATIFGFKNNASDNKTMKLPPACGDIPRANMGELTEEELCDVREATQKTVEEYLSNNGNSRNNDRPSTQRNEDIV